MQAFDGLDEGGGLLMGTLAVQLVGARQVGHQYDARHLRQCRQTCVRGAETGNVQAKPVHATVQLQPHRQRARAVERGQCFQLPRRTHREPQVMLGHQRHFARLEDAFQQQDRGTDTGLAQFQRLFNRGHTEAVGLAFQ
ncbi:hypothetical protein D3C73_1111610 [compost metagenome]